jgi:hypothetical protein
VLTLVDIPSARAERAVYHANEIVADFRTDWPLIDPSSQRAQGLLRDALLRLVTTAEMFAGEHLLDLMDQRLPTDDLVARLWDERAPRIIRDWPNRLGAWNDLFDVEWRYAHWTEVNGFVTARNIIAHGMGRLTRSQLRKGRVREDILTKLGQAKLKLDGHELVLSDADIERCAGRVVEFVGWLDRESRRP